MRVACLQSARPLTCAGSWALELISKAGGESTRLSGSEETQFTVADIAAENPDVMILMAPTNGQDLTSAWQSAAIGFFPFADLPVIMNPGKCSRRDQEQRIFTAGDNSARKVSCSLVGRGGGKFTASDTLSRTLRRHLHLCALEPRANHVAAAQKLAAQVSL